MKSYASVEASATEHRTLQGDATRLTAFTGMRG